MGAAYQSNSDNVRIQSNSRDRTLEFIKNNIHLSPIRLICQGIKADSIINKTEVINAKISFDEVFILANNSLTNTNVIPEIENVVSILIKARNGVLHPPENFERRFHLLNHTNFLITKRNNICIREPINNQDRFNLINKLEYITTITNQFNDFDNADTQEVLLNFIKNGSWGKYFDAIGTFNFDKIEKLTNNYNVEYDESNTYKVIDSTSQDTKKHQELYELRELSFNNKNQEKKSKKNTITDPEITRIKSQRANFSHKQTLVNLYDFLDQRGVKSLENEHIDLYAELPANQKFIFEIKSLSKTNLLSQSRKGLSQLYEYRYRYKEKIGNDAQLCLVFPAEPNQISWLQEYLCLDRNIGVVWFNKKGKLIASNYCKNMVKPLLTLSTKLK